VTANVLQFPVISRREYIRNQAERMACMNTQSAERYLSYQLRVQANAMRRRGIAEDVITHQLKSIEEAIRYEFLQTVEEA
jgi:hypothetical protein